jgi:hypothetical protein
MRIRTVNVVPAVSLPDQADGEVEQADVAWYAAHDDVATMRMLLL